MIEQPFYQFSEYKIPNNFKRVVANFISDSDTRFIGIEFSDKHGNKLLSVGTIRNSVETFLDDDERLVGIASRNEINAVHHDF